MMSWNRSEKNTSEDRAKVHKGNFRPTISLVVCLIGTLLVLILINQKHLLGTKKNKSQDSSFNDANRSNSVRRSFIAKTKPVKTATINKPEIHDADLFFAPKTLGRIVIWKIVNPPIFTNQFEGFVADVLTAIPGERFLESELNDDFDESFRESLKHKIVINADDSESVVAMKHAVMEAKEEVRRRVAEGERPRDIVLAARDELNKIADYRDKVQAAFNEYLLTETDPKEILRFEKEANALLDEYGACHIDGPHDEETAYEMMISAKEEKIQELTKELKK